MAPSQGSWTWCVPVSRFDDSCAIAWLAAYKELTAHPGVGYLELSTNETDVLLVSVFFLSVVRIMAVTHVRKSL